VTRSSQQRIGRCCMAVLVAGSSTMFARNLASEVASPLASQGIRPDAIGTVSPAALSHDGRLVAFVARDGDFTNRGCCTNVYVLDRSTGTVTEESVVPDVGRRSDSGTPSLSADGRILAFETMVATQTASGTSARRRVIVKTRQDRATRRSLVGPTGEEPDGEVADPVVSGDGRFVAFTSDATNLVTGVDANGRQTDVYLWQLDSGEVTRMSVDNSSTQLPRGASHSPSVSHDGERVAFVSTARLVPEDGDDMADVYIRDVRLGRTFLVSRGPAERTADGASHSPAISSDGRYVAFVSKATNLVPRDRNDEHDVFLFDAESGSTTLVSATSKGESANAASRAPAVSGNARYIAYQSTASNLGGASGCPRVRSDTNLLPDIYVLDRVTRCVTRLSGSPDREWWTPSVAPAIDRSGSLVVFSSTQPTTDEDASIDFDLFGSEIVATGLTQSNMTGARMTVSSPYVAVPWVETGRLRSSLAAWRRWHGRGVSCARHTAGSRGRDQDSSR
jgi:Tol biopolymer transport system component